jgi:hypothetical protein
MDMIKISHVMTVYTMKKSFVYMYNSVLYVYNINNNEVFYICIAS